MQLHTILHMYYILNYINITSILHACNASVITYRLHAITCNITCQLHAFKIFNYKRFKFQRNYMMFQVIACNYMFVSDYMIFTCKIHEFYIQITCCL